MYNNNEVENFFDGLIELPEVGQFGYDWQILRSYYDPERKIFLYSYQVGCSCDSFDDDDFVGDHEIAYSKADFMKAVRTYTDDDYDLDSMRKAIFGL